MKRTIVPSLLGFFLLGAVGSASASGISLADWGYNVDGALTLAGDPIPSYIDDSGFDYGSGLGGIDITITGTGAHNAVLWLDHEIDEPSNTFFNEDGMTDGTLAAGQSWEIDAPGLGSLQNGTAGTQYFGDIFDNFSAGTLDDRAFYDAFDDQDLLSPPDDVSMALGWDFILATGEEALVHFSVSDIDVPTGFYIRHFDPDSDKAIYFSSELTIKPVAGVPEPAVWLLMFLGLIGLAFVRDRSGRPVYGH